MTQGPTPQGDAAEGGMRERTETDLAAVRAAISATPPEGLGALFSELAASLGSEQASRLWLAAFASTDAAET